MFVEGGFSFADEGEVGEGDVVVVEVLDYLFVPVEWELFLCWVVFGECLGAS